MKINGSEVKTVKENERSKQTKRNNRAKQSSGNTPINKKSASKKGYASDKASTADDAKTLTPQGIIGLVIAAVLIVCVITAVVFGVMHVGKATGGSTKDDKNQTVAEQLSSGKSSSGSSSSSPTDEETFPGLTSDTSKNDATLKEWEKKASEEGDKQGADYYNSLQGTGLKKDDVSTDDSYARVASGVVSDIKTLSCDAFYAKYNKVTDKNCDAYGTIQNNAKNEDPEYLDRYSDNTETWLTYSMNKSGSGFTVFVSKGSVVTDVSFAFESALE